MLISLKEALNYADSHSCAIAAVNTPVFESLVATIRVAEQHNVPVILAHAQSHEKINRITDIGPAMLELARRSSVPCVVHVDHGENLDYIRTGLELGFTSVMLDGSRLPFEENVARTAEAVRIAQTFGADVEGELGVMTGNENGDPDQGVADESLYTDPQVAADFVARTGVTCLAASFGTVHGLYHREPHLNLDLITQLRTRTGVPIVMHGGSGLSDNEYRACIARGVRKINYYTYSAKAGLDGARALLADKDEVFVYPDVAVAATDAIADDVDAFVGCLYGIND